MKLKQSLTSFSVLLCLFTAAARGQDKTSDAGDAKRPLSVGIAVDCSGSQRLLIEKMISAVKLAAERTLPADETFVVKFISTDKITLVQEFTHDRDLLIEAADELFVEGGQTALIDAVNFSAQYFTEGSKSGLQPRRALILITDGDDRESISKTDATVKLLKENGVSVYSIGIGEGKIAPRLLEKLARETGGKVFLPRTTAELTAAIGEIYRSLRGERANK